MFHAEQSDDVLITDGDYDDDDDFKNLATLNNNKEKLDKVGS